MTEPVGARADGEVAAVAKRAESGVRWNLVAAVATNAARIVSLTVLARLLSKDDFGLVAQATLVLSLLSGIRDVGLGPALLQKKAITKRHEGTLFAFSVALGFGIAVTVVAIAPLLARYLAEPALPNVLTALAGLFFLRSVATLSMTLCKRDLRFGVFAATEAGSYVLGAMAAVGAAWAGLGPWALVLGYAVEAVIACAIYVWMYPPTWTWRIDRVALRELGDYGAGHTVAHLAALAAIWGDNAVVAGALPKAQLAAYARAYDIVRFPANAFTSIVGSVLLPSYARLQDQTATLATAFLRTVTVSSFLLFPATAVLIVLAPAVIYVLLGPSWMDVVAPFRVLLIGMHMRTAYKAGDLVLRALGDVWTSAWILIAYAGCVIGGASLMVGHGITAVAWSTLAAIMIAYFLLSGAAIRRVPELTWRQFASAHGVGVAMAIALGLLATAGAAASQGLHPALQLVGVGGGCGILWGAFMWWLARRGDATAVWLVARVRKAKRAKQPPTDGKPADVA